MQDLFRRLRRLSPGIYGLPLLSGLLLIPAFPPWDQGWLAWAALVPLLRFCLVAPLRRAPVGGFLFGLPLHLYLNLYLSGVLFTYLSPLLAVTAMAGLVIALCCFNALFTLGAIYLRRRVSPLALTFALPALWVLVEYSRSLGFIGYNAGYLGYTQWCYPAVLNLTSFYGYWGLPLVMVAFQTTVVQALAGNLRGKPLLAAGLVVGILAGAGFFIPEIFPVKDKAAIETALIQGNSSPEEILAPGGREKIMQRYLAMTRRALELDPQVELVVWPETVVDLNITGSPAHRPSMEKLAEELEIAILYGARVRSAPDLFNSIALLSPGEADFQIYHKHRLVPFVEYFPYENLLNRLVDLDLRLGGYTAGRELPLLIYNGLPLGGVVCFESYFGSHTRRLARRGAEHLFVLTNDAWFGETIGLEQHAQVAAIRAAEMGIGVTQVANSGITISFDYRGRELLRSGKAEREILYLPLKTRGRITVYRYAGDYLPLLGALYLMACLFLPYWGKHARPSRLHR